MLRRLRPSAPLLACSERLQRKFLRRALAVFLDGAPAARVHAFLFVRATALALPPPALGAALKARRPPGAPRASPARRPRGAAAAG